MELVCPPPIHMQKPQHPVRRYLEEKPWELVGVRQDQVSRGLMTGGGPAKSTRHKAPPAPREDTVGSHRLQARALARTDPAAPGSWTSSFQNLEKEVCFRHPDYGILS